MASIVDRVDGVDSNRVEFTDLNTERRLRWMDRSKDKQTLGWVELSVRRTVFPEALCVMPSSTV